MQNLGRLAVKVKTLELSDSLGKAAEAVRASTIGAAPVVRFGQIVGLVTSELLADYLLEVERGPRTEDTVRAKLRTVGELPLESVIAVPAGLTAAEALRFFHANELDVAPVVDALGHYLGMVSTAELVSAVCGRVRPPLVGGMATPFGVYLTGGGVRGGVGDFALMTTGIFICVLQLISITVVDWLWSPHVLLSIPWLAGWAASINADWPAALLERVILSVLFRYSWLVTGFHAAEHQVVHTIEAGDDLLPEVVRNKPRVHPRCGTNLVAAVLIMSAFWSAGRSAGGNSFFSEVPLAAMIFTWIFWRRLGGWMQQHITTRPPNLRELKSGIFAAEQLLERYQTGAPAVVRPMQRIWNMGLLQVLSGSCLVIACLQVLTWIAPWLVPANLRPF